MNPRTLTATLHQATRTFPAVVVTGPRQSGKTTLLQKQFGADHAYINLEDPDTRRQVAGDPRGFLERIQKPAIIDEIQYEPELLSYIKSAIDADRQPGKWLLTGSQNFALMEKVSESLAGRAAILSLLPFSASEAAGFGQTQRSVENILSMPQQRHENPVKLDLSTLLLRGLYPQPSSQPFVPRDLWCGSYITTYLERDIRNLKQVGDLGLFETFLRACAVRTGQILDFTSVAREIGVSFATAKRWLSLLETGYQIYLLRPYYRNIGKRLVKRPKLYFTDTGLASYLLGIHTPETLFASPQFGALFETFIVTDFLKRFAHHGQQAIPMYYLRTQDGLEVDLVIELGDKLHLIEIKAGRTISPAHAASLIRAKRNLGTRADRGLLISDAPNSFSIQKGITNEPWPNILLN